MAPFCFWSTFVFASKDGAADAAPTYMMRQTNIFRLAAVNFCLLQPETHNDKRKRPDSAVIDMGDTIIKNVPFTFYDLYCKCVDVFKLTLLNKCFCLVQCEKYFLSKIYTIL